ncbi:DUF4157 domain-containing protein [Nostoc sp. FACHB-190]|uniref:eCIS core domain-containing protein n=1 Tax=Nostoc sp. FACHB-190 TaxID=2692838 RepID=UPI00168648B6|nr:DUF4157 domain-containing protein [Nostoc sp. FACHB-190]MBD2303342.1 DUF4157 domain-containing protein [Nostoc sp. FACHB-190]
MKTQVPAKKTDSGVGGRSYLPVSSHKSPDVLSDFSSETELENSALHPDGYNLANIPISAKLPENNQRNRTHSLTSKLPIQAKLTIGQPNDKYEQEADRVAEQVMCQKNIPATQKSRLGNTEGSQLHEYKGEKRSAEQAMDLTIRKSVGKGQRLPDRIRESMESSIGADFSSVNVHKDEQSEQLNQSLQAKAFTIDQDIFFRPKEYNPASSEGLKLIAHELTHVCQQSGQKIKPRQGNTIADLKRSEQGIGSRIQRVETEERKSEAEEISSIPARIEYIKAELVATEKEKLEIEEQNWQNSQRHQMNNVSTANSEEFPTWVRNVLSGTIPDMQESVEGDRKWDAVDDRQQKLKKELEKQCIAQKQKINPEHREMNTGIHRFLRIIPSLASQSKRSFGINKNTK